MRAYLQRRGHCPRRSDSSCLDEESIPKIEGTANASGVASSGIILGDFVSTVPLMLYGLLITGAWMRFSLPRTSILLSDVVHVSTVQFWYTAAISV